MCPREAGQPVGARIHGSLAPSLPVKEASLLALFLALAPFIARGAPPPAYAFHPGPAARTVESLAPPQGFTRTPLAPGSFGAWLRGLPLLPDGAQVHLFDGRLKPDQSVHAAVIDIDVGRRDLQQCADAVMRLRAEYLWSRGDDRLCFRFTSGDAAEWRRFRDGERPVIGRTVRWEKREKPDASRASFDRWLQTVFTYAGTASLERELSPVADPFAVEPGDVFIQGGYPGHAELVVDVAVNARGERAFLLAQSYMPAQQIHVVRNPAGDGPWFRPTRGPLVTPEWTFPKGALRRFAGPGCGPR